MENEVGQISRSSLTIAGGAKEALRIFNAFTKAGVTFYAFGFIPQMDGTIQVDLFPTDPGVLEKVAARLKVEEVRKTARVHTAA